MSGFNIAFEAPTMETSDSPDLMVWHAWCKAARAAEQPVSIDMLAP
jgi:hypothetical protein